MKFSPEKLLRSRNSVMTSVFDHFDPFLHKIDLRGGYYGSSGVKTGLKFVIFKMREIFTITAFEVEKLNDDVRF